MRKLSFLILAFPLLFASCGSDDDKDNSISLKEAEKTMAFSEKYQINATSDNKITYSSENAYHATVSETGLVTAGRVGETIISLNNGNETKKVKIKIEPKSSLYPDPFIEFGATKAQVKAKFETLPYEDETTLGYNTDSETAPILFFTFADEKMTSCEVMVNPGNILQLRTHLTERLLPLTSEDSTGDCINAMTVDKATLLVTYKPHDACYWTVTYMPGSAATYAKSAQSPKPFDSSVIDKLMQSMN